MRKIYSLVLLAAALLIGTNAWAQTTLTLGTAESGATYQTLQAAIDAAAEGQTTQINMISPLSTNATAWLGTENVTDDPKHIILDLQGYTYEYTGTKNIAIALTHGTLEIKSTGTNVGIIQTGSATDELIRVYGTYEKINAKTETPFAHLIVRENVTLQSTKLNVLSVDVLRPGQADKFGKSDSDFKYACDFFYNPSSSSSGWGVANGVRLDIYGNVTSTVKYALKVNGCIRYGKDYLEADGVTPKTGYPYLRDNYAPKYVNGANTGTYTITTSDGDYSPYIYVAPTGRLATNDTKKEAVAAYSSGYGRWRIEGYCGGSTGLYIKSGAIEVHDAEIVSKNTDPHNTPDGKGSGVDAGGSAVVVESNATYSGNISVTISGDSRIEGASGYAIEETKTTAPTTEVSGVEIQGGTIVGGDMGAIIITDETKDSTSVVGGNFEGSIQVKDADDQTGTTATDVEASTLIPPTSTMHTTEVVIDGKTTVVVSEGVAPTAAQTKTKWSDIAGFTSGSNAKWTGTGETDGVGTISGLVTLGELQILSATALTGAGQQKLTITSTGELHVNHLMMNEYAQIVVEAGGKLIVEGEQGILAPSVDNILLKTSETAQAIFLFNPAVSSNRHPNATVEMISASYRNSATDRHNHRFGIPMYTGVTSIDASPAAPTAFYRFDYENNSWLNIGYINDNTKPAIDLTQMNKPFEYYQLLCNIPSGSTTTFTFTGSLVGNVNAAKTIAPDVWYGICNSYMGEMDLEQIINSMSGTMSKTIWTYETSGASAWAWKVANLATAVFDGIDKIKPMQAFLIHNVSDDAATEATLSYETTVWNPAMGIAGAPARRLSAASWTSAKMIVSSDNGYGDQLLLIQGNDFTSDFDNGFDAEKYFNGDINFYISDSRAMSVLATDNLADTYLGFSCVNGGIYTIDFSNVNGESYDLIDLEANQTVHMTEGASYQFAANDNEQNDYRFRIVARQEMPTDIETVENGMIKADGVYTITGQYLGDLNVWNTLPAGLYIVNGEKKVK